MERSRIFTQQLYSSIEESTLRLINASDDVVGAGSLGSPRAVGDAVQGLLGNHFSSFIPEDILKRYDVDFARRAMADFAFQDTDGFYYLIDCKTHNEETCFNMPNLTSVQRIARLYEDDKTYFVILFITYGTKEGRIEAKSCHFLPVEHLAWSSLTIGALGWGQIQIKDSNNITIDRTQTRKNWMLSLCDNLTDFYPKEIAKIGERISYFEAVRSHWSQKEDY